MLRKIDYFYINQLIDSNCLQNLITKCPKKYIYFCSIFKKHKFTFLRKQGLISISMYIIGYMIMDCDEKLMRDINIFITYILEFQA